MTNVLLAAHPTVGHTNALRAIGKQLLGDGHTVAMAVVSSHVLASPMLPAHLQGTLGLAQQLARDGIKLAPLDFSPRMLWQAAQIPLRRDMALLDAEVRLFTAGIERHAMNVAIHAAHMSADIVVGDYLMPAAMIGAQIAHVPYVALYHSAMPFPKMLDSPFGCGLVRMPAEGSVWRQRGHPLKRLGDMMDRMVHSAARNVGLRLSLPSLLTQPISDTLNLLTTAPEIELGMPALQPLVQMVGPCVPAPDATDAAHPALHLPDRGVPQVFLSLGRAFGHSAATFDLILEGLAQLDVQVVVDAGSSLKQLQRWQSEKIHIFQHVPRAALLQQVDVAITYGGNNTVQEALAAGCPMVVIPLGGEQDVNARRVEQLGAGVACRPAQLSPEDIRSAVQAALAPEKAAQARALCGQLQRYGGTRAAADAIIAASQPWANAVGYPVF